ncbi:MAG: histidine--tRNA ligase [Firmicutes bacterium]|nr:histidine--tRNA ligase [Bacillota bacterium]
MISIPKGMKDVLPADSAKWQFVEELFRKTAEKYGFTEIRTPMVEHTELFARGIGDTTDVVQKEMYTFEISERSLTLKPEGTAGVVRSFIENKLYAEGLPAKYYYITPCYRYEKMQKGRQREFHQFGIELFGSPNMLADAEVILLAYDFLKSVGLDDVKLHINSIGCKNCRAEYRKALQDFLRPNLDKLCDTCKGRFDKNPMRILDCKSPECKKIAEGAPRMLDYLDDECRKAFEDLKKLLDIYGVPYEVDPGIVRGLDYYTKTAFEFVSNKLGAQSTVCGGGRYDDLIEELGGPATPGVGFGLGIERLLLIMEACGVLPQKAPGCDILVAGLGEAAKTKALELTKQMRDAGKRVIIDVMDRGLKAQFKYADRIGARYVAVIGDDELAKGVVSLRDMEKSSQTEVPADKVIEVLNG